MWLGKRANNKDKPLHLKWVSSPTRILGIYFSYDEKGNNEMNFDLKINKLQAKLDIWRSQDLTLFGKTMIIKTLGVSSLIIGNPGSLCVTRDITQVNYREHMRRSLGLKLCWKMEIKIDETYHVEIFCCP